MQAKRTHLVFAIAATLLVTLIAVLFPAGAAAAPSDDDIVNHALVAMVEYDNVDGEERTQALTGQELGVTFHAYNDNPNSSATTTVRVFVSQPTLPTDHERISLVDVEREFDIEGTIGGRSTTIVGSWNLVDPGGEADVDGADDDTTVAYLEFSIPAGASLSEEVPLFVASGWDEEVEARVYVRYQHDGEWIEPDVDEDGTNDVSLTWTGSFLWDGVTKHASRTTVSIEEGVASAGTVAYTIGINNAQMGLDQGVVLAESLGLTDTLVLPEGMLVPEGWALSDDGASIMVGDEALYAVKADKCTIDALEVSADRTTITFSLSATNDGFSSSFDPLDGATATLDPTLLQIDEDSLAEGAVIDNEVEVTVTSVPEGSNQQEPRRLTYRATADAQVAVEVNAVSSIEKRIVQVTDDKGTVVVESRQRGSSWELYATDADASATYLDASTGQPIVRNGYRVRYEVALVAGSSAAITVRDEMDASLAFRTGSASYTVQSEGGEESTPAGLTPTYSASTHLLTITVPAGAASRGDTVRISYEATVDTSKLSTSTQASTIQNKASVGDKSDTTTIRTPEPGTLTFDKELVSRYTRRYGGGSYQVWRDETDGLLHWNGSRSYLIGDVGYPEERGSFSQDQLDTALHLLNAGDVLEYLITVDNQTGTAVTGTIYDYRANAYRYNDNDWEHFAVTSTQLGAASTSVRYSMMQSTSATQATGWSNSASSWSYRAHGAVPKSSAETSSAYGDLSYLATPDVGSSSRSTSWRITASNPIAPYATYRQTVVDVVPGDNSYAMTWTNYRSPGSDGIVYSGNYAYNRLRMEYFAATSGNATSAERPHAWAVFYPSTGGTRTTSNIFFNIEAQLYVSTGVAATGYAMGHGTTISGRTYYGPYADTSTYPTDFTGDRDLTTFRGTSDSAVVNYVYLYNDSDQPLDLTKYSLRVTLPAGFTFTGLAYPEGHNSSYAYNVYPFSSPRPPVYGYQFMGTHSSSNGRYTNGSNEIIWANKWRSTSSYYGSPYGSSVNQLATDISAHGSNDMPNFTYSVGSGTYNNFTTVNRAAYKPTWSTNGTTIPANSGYVLYYVATFQGTEYAKSLYSADGTKATFGAYLERTDGGDMQQATTCVSTFRSYNGGGYSSLMQYAQNNGIANSFADYTNSSHSHYRELSTGNDRYWRPGETAGSYGLAASGYLPNTIWSYASLTMNRDELCVSVDKEVVKNSGDAGTTDGSLEWPAGEEPSGGWHSDYDDYNQRYIPIDGVHSTVDGTVTWKTTVTNAGDSTDATVTYADLNYGTLVDIVDSPYELLSIHAPELVYAKVDSSGAVASQERVALDIAIAPESWVDQGNGFSTYQTTLETSGGNVPVRITRSTLLGGSAGWGYDVISGDKNADATKYVIELGRVRSGSYVMAPVLVPKNSTSGSFSSTELYLTFQTTDAIETNYNSFGVWLGGVNPSILSVGNDAEVTTADAMHAGAAAGGSSASPESLASLVSPLGVAGRIAKVVMPEARGASDEGTLPLGGSYGNPDGSQPVVAHADWTDTSYTDGVKWVTWSRQQYLDQGNLAEYREYTHGPYVNTRGAGNAFGADEGPTTMNGYTVAPGSQVHITLQQESKLWQSESYDYYQGLDLYDLWGVADDVELAGENVLTPLRSTFLVTDNHGNTLVEGVDYKLYYTTDRLVTTEHHTVGPVHTLYYASDIQALGSGSAEWVEWPRDVESPEGAAGVRVQILPESDFYCVYNPGMDSSHKTSFADWTLQVDFEAQVSEKAIPGTAYPDVEAWSASVHDRDTNELKPFVEDTTAALFKVNNRTEASLTKRVVNADGADISSGFADKEFTYLIWRDDYLYLSSYNTPSSYGSHGSSHYLEGLALLTVHAGETVDLKDPGDSLTILYRNRSASFSASTFFTSGRRYFVAELDSVADARGSNAAANAQLVPTYDEGFSYLSFEASSREIETEMDLRITSYFSNTTSTSYDYASTIFSTAPAWVRSLLAGRYTYYYGYAFLTPTTSNNWAVDMTNTNRTSTSAVTVSKVDAETGETVQSATTFQVLDADGNAVRLVEGTSGTWKYVGDGSSAGTTNLVVRGTVRVTGLAPGAYTLAETEAPAGYDLADPVPFTVGYGKSPAAVSVEVADSSDGNPVNGTARITKVDATGATITSGPATFQVYDSQDDGAEPLAFAAGENGAYTLAASGSGLVTSLKTSDGVLELVGLDAGTYYLVETEAPLGYAAVGTTLAEATPFSVSRANPTTALSVRNELVSATVVVEKVDSVTGEPIHDNPATFQLMDEDGVALSFASVGDGAWRLADEGETDVTTGRDGTLALRGLPKGDYVLVEVSAPAGYVLSAEPVSLTVLANQNDPITVPNEALPFTLRVEKRWQLEGGTKNYPLGGVGFTLYQVSDDGTEATPISSATSNSYGMLEFGELDQNATYLLYEELPEGYAQGTSGVITWWRDPASEALLADQPESSDAEQVQVFRIDVAAGTSSLTEEDGLWVCPFDVTNVRGVAYGGVYASTSYKTIDNHKAAETYEGLDAATGYGFYYTERDAEEGNLNYVLVANPGDVVTYTLNVTNASDSEFAGMVLIDRMPERGDTGVVNLREERDSEFAVSCLDDNLVVTVDGRVLDDGLYEVTYSDKVQFTEGDFNGTTSWDGSAEDAASFRVALSDEFRLEPGATLRVSFDGVVADDARAGQFAWNDFAYRYVPVDAGGSPSVAQVIVRPSLAKSVSAGWRAVGLGTGVAGLGAGAVGLGRTSPLTPEPPKVGVTVMEGHALIEGSKTFSTQVEEPEIESAEFTFRLTISKGDAAYVEYVDESGERVAFPAGGLDVTVEVPLGETVDFEFPELWFRHSGAYEFLVSEVKPAVSGFIVYQDEPCVVTIDGTHLDDYSSDEGIRPIYQVAGELLDRAEFTNEYVVTDVIDVDFSATKLYEGGTLADGQFSFSLTGPDGKEIAVVQNSADGAVTFPTVSVTEAGTYEYVIREVVPADRAGVTYDEHEVTATVTVERLRNGHLVGSVAYEGELTFTNVAPPKPSPPDSPGTPDEPSVPTATPDSGDLAAPGWAAALCLVIGFALMAQRRRVS